MDNVVHDIIFWWEQYWGSSWYPYLWAAAFLYLLIFERKRKNAGYLIAFQCLLCFLYFCPVTAALIQKCIGGLVYWRVIWLFPVVPALALAMTSLLSRIRKKGLQAVLVIACVGILAASGTSVWSAGNYVKVSNHQKVPEEAAQIANILLAERSAEDSLIAADNSIAPYLRVYDPSFQLAFGRDGRGARSRNARHLYTRMSAEEPDYKVIGKRARKEKVQLLVLQLSQEQKEEAFAAMEHYGYEWVTAVNDYNIFHFPIAKSGES